MTDDVLDLDAEPAHEPSRRRGSSWSRHRTLVVALAVLVALGVGIAVVLNPPPPPEPELLGLRNGPTEAWQTDEMIFDARPIADDRLLVNSATTLTSFRVRMLNMVSGDELWHWDTFETQRRPVLADLPGTGWVGVVLHDEVALLNRESGAVEHRMALPASQLAPMDSAEPGVPSEQVWVASSDRGTIFIGRNRPRMMVQGNGQVVVFGDGDSELFAYDPTDLETPLWHTSAAVGEEIPIGWAPLNVTEEGGYAFFPLDVSWAGYLSTRTVSGPMSLVVDLADGTRPPWWVAPPDLALIDGVVVLTDASRAIGVEAATDTELWAADPGFWDPRGVDDTLYLVSAAKNEIRRLDSRTGALRWVAEVSLNRTPPESPVRAFWHTDPIVETLTPRNGQSALVRLDTASGREVMRHELPEGLEHLQVLVGDGQLVLLAYQVERDDPDDQVTQVARGIDPDSGELLWEHHFDGSVAVFGRHLVGFTEVDGTPRTVVYR